jgi:hypothetical protein
MGAWYWIGVATGLGAASGLLAAGIAARVAIVLGGLIGAGLGLAIDLWQLGSWGDIVAGVVGGVLGALGAAVIVTGALRRGGTRGGLAVFALVGAFAVAALALVPVLGFLEAVALPALGRRLRSRTPEKYAGLRTLARD